MITGKPPILVALAPGSIAYAAINKNSCVNFAPQTATSIVITPPNGGKPLIVNLPESPAMNYCGGGQPDNAVGVTPVEPTLAGIYPAR
jgi:hypothetical protein